MQTIGLIAGIYICGLVSKKQMIGGSLVGIGPVGLYPAAFPGYRGFLIAFGVLAILGEVTCWPVLPKAIRRWGMKRPRGGCSAFWKWAGALWM